MDLSAHYCSERKGSLAVIQTQGNLMDRACWNRTWKQEKILLSRFFFVEDKGRLIIKNTLGNLSLNLKIDRGYIHQLKNKQKQITKI